MQIDFLGANCLKLKAHGTTIFFDDNLPELGAKSRVTTQDIVCLTDRQITPPTQYRLLFDSPGNYEVNEILIEGFGISGFKEDQITAYKVVANNISLVVTGQITPELTDEQCDKLGLIDVLCLPIDGGLNVAGAWQLVKILEPKLIIPTYYRQTDFKGSHSWTAYEEFVQKSQLEPELIKNSLRLKKSDLGEHLSLKIFQT